MNRITMLRKEKGMSQIALSMELNVSQKTISAYESGKSEPGIDTLKRMADIFQTSIDYIVGYTDVRHSIDRITQQGLNKLECCLLAEFRELSDEKKQVALGVIIGLKNYNF